MRADLPWLTALLLVGALPLLSLLGHPGAMLADPLSEWPVKLWVFETFAEVGLFGGRVDASAFPVGGPLNNPDVVGTALTALVRPILGRAASYNLLVMLQLQATLLATWALVRSLLADRGAAFFAAVAFALTPMVLVYCVAGAVTDMLNLWPYPLLLRALWRGLAAGSGRAGAEAGAWAVAGFLTCPYNFVVFSTLAVPALPVLPWLVGAGGARGAARALAAFGAVLGVGVGLDAFWTWELTHAADSQIPADLIEVTRHRPPYPFLEPGHVDRYTAYLADYVAITKGALIEREAGSRYLRAFSPGLVALALAGAGLLLARRPAHRFWVVAAAWCALVSTGPFLPLNRLHHLDGPGNLAWRLAAALPGGDLILEPFRYALPAALGVAVGAAVAVDRLAGRLPWLGPVAALAWLAEEVWVSPVPVPLPTVVPVVPAVYARLDQYVGPGAVLELPFFDTGTDRFLRVHFLHQRVHGRPIPDEVTGLPGRYFRENQFVADLVATERPMGRLSVKVTRPERVEADLRSFVEDGFAAVVVTPNFFPTRNARDRVAARLEAAFGPPVVDGDRWIYRVRPAP